MCITRFIISFILSVGCFTARADQIIVGGHPGQLDIRSAGENSIRITLKPISFTEDFPVTPAVLERQYPAPVITLRDINRATKKSIGSLIVEVLPQPLTINIKNSKGQNIQQLIFTEEGKISFMLSDHPVLGMGEGGPKPGSGVNWRTLPIEYDRRGRYHNMLPRWQADAYGSRNPVPMLIGTDGWAIFVASPWVEVDLRGKELGFLIPWKPTGKEIVPQTTKNQGLDQGKGLPPVDKIIPGLFDIFVFDAHNPILMMKDFSTITGPAALPPKWAMGYMQSHRTLESDSQMTGIVDTFRAKKIPVDAVIYLGTGFTKVGWNKQQPSFEFNPVVFRNTPQSVISSLHSKNVKVVLHMVPWDRDKLPTLHGTIPSLTGEIIDASHIQSYWGEHLDLIKAGVDAFWPDEGDWFNLFERIKRHQLYYQGHLSANPDLRPWSLHRNGYPGIAQWGGWVWSGDTESSWKSLETQIAVGINYSLSLSPFWGSDIGGFFPNEELTGELYARWYQFGAFCPSFRSHGQTWWTRLPWGWGLSNMGPLENKTNPRQSELNNPAIEPVCRKYTELRYQLLPYNYTLAWEARNSGMPMIRAMWLHYPDDPAAESIGNQYMWGRDMLIAPVFIKGALSREVYLPDGDWYDWWDSRKIRGGKKITRNIDLSVMPIYVRAGAIIPFDPIRQYTSQLVNEPTVIKVFPGSDGQFNLYDDDGLSLDYLSGKASWTSIIWDDKEKQVSIIPGAPKGFKNVVTQRIFIIELITENTKKEVYYKGQPVVVKF